MSLRREFLGGPGGKGEEEWCDRAKRVIGNSRE